MALVAWGLRSSTVSRAGLREVEGEPRPLWGLARLAGGPCRKAEGGVRGEECALLGLGVVTYDAA